MGEEVTWRGRHFGVWQTLTSRITAFDRPRHFRDSMVKGAFRFFDHDHHFVTDNDATVMEDTFNFASPLWLLGKVADALFVRRYMTELLVERAGEIRRAAESEAWKTYLAH
jgi:ligand-binding SRPBCC domain-containing protein